MLSFYRQVIEGIEDRDGWLDVVYLDIKKAFDRILHKGVLWKLKHKWAERESIRIDARLFERQRNENCNQGNYYKLEECNKRSTAGVSISTHNVPNICK